jgi:hypothetical protein
MDQSVQRLNLRLYSWTHSIRMGRISKRGTMQAYLLKFENLVLAGEDGTNPKLNFFELCPFCLEAGIAKYGGAEHFRIVNSPDKCCNKNIRGAILTALEAMEGTLRRLEPSIQKWKDHARICNPYDETLRDADQDAHFQHDDDRLRSKFPVLCAIGWIVNSTEDDDNPFTMGMRIGTLPSSLTLPPRFAWGRT